jgi:hypothetical protein
MRNFQLSAKEQNMTFAIMNRQQVCIVAGVVFLAFGLQLFCGLQLYAQQADLRAAAAAKAAAGRVALTHKTSHASGAIGTFTTFDVPGAVNGTFPNSINPAGMITGAYNDANFLSHGFLRANNGTLTKFDVPGATNGTFPSGINPAGTITGSYFDADFVGHGFLRGSDGSFTTIDAPGAVIGMIGTFPLSINPAVAVTGTYYLGFDFVGHGFLRAGNGSLTTFDPPDAGTTDPGTTAVDINPEGVILGTYIDAKNGSHGFLRARDGTFTTFDPPGTIETFAPFSSGPDLSMDPQGVITGTFFEHISGNPFGGNFRVFVRAKNGTFTTFDAATYPPCCIWSFPSGISPAGVITGSFNDGFSINHGFLRARDGTLATFDAPGAGTGFNQGTAPLGIDPAGEIMGHYIDSNNRSHGFLLESRP